MDLKNLNLHNLVDNEPNNYSPQQLRAASRYQDAITYSVESKLPPIRVQNSDRTRMSLMASAMMGHREDENCHIDRSELRQEKANRLGEGGRGIKPPALADSNPKKPNQLESQLIREMLQRKSMPEDILAS